MAVLCRESLKNLVVSIQSYFRVLLNSTTSLSSESESASL